MPEHELGRYTGRLIWEPLPDGRRMRTIEDFGFMDADRLHWPVPAQSIVDGASIPQVLWSLIGGPFEGKYRDASVVHDYYCDVRSADWRSVHRVFYRAMLVSGVSVPRAKVLYAAVYFAGPRWSDTVVENVRLGTPAVPIPYLDDDVLFSKPATDDNVMFFSRTDPATLALSKMMLREGKSVFEWCVSARAPAHSNSEVTLQLELVSEFVERVDPSLRDIENAIDGAMDLIPANGSPRAVSVGRLEGWGQP